MRIAGLDLALAKTGLALPNGTFSTITPPRHLGRGYDRHWYIGERLLTLIEEDGGVDLVVIEDYAPHGPGINALIAVAEVGGVVRACFTRHRIAFTLVRPSALKLYATGVGNAKKAVVFDAARVTAEADIAAARDSGVTRPAYIDAVPANYDEADAYWCRRMALDHYAGRYPADERRAHSLATVDWPVFVPA